MNIVIMGPPGSGKGTQARMIVEEQQVVHISTGDMLREAVSSGSDLGRRVESVMATGELVSDELMMEIIRERLQQPDAAGGWLLDGFPRTEVQADGLADLLAEIGQPIDAVLALTVGDDEIVRRLGGRLTCPSCGAVTGAGDAVAGGTCGTCGAEGLVQRTDDVEDTVRRRLDIYRLKTEPAVVRLGERFPLHEVDGEGDPASITMRIAGVLA